jgi:hypothetical protein
LAAQFTISASANASPHNLIQEARALDDIACMPITSVSAAYQTNAAEKNTPAPKSPAPSTPPAQKADSVHLSKAALAASGDADHDGH